MFLKTVTVLRIRRIDVLPGHTCFSFIQMQRKFWLCFFKALKDKAFQHSEGYWATCETSV